VGFVRWLSRAGYRPLLEGGVRIFEWKGPMLHAKTAVADGRWARVGSTNLNLTSWLGNWELDVAVEDEGFARSMEAMYLEDLERATEVVLGRDRRLFTAGTARRPPRGEASGGSAGRAAVSAISLGRAVGAAVTSRRPLGPAESRVMAAAGLLLLILSGVTVRWPWLVAVPLAGLGVLVGTGLLLRAYRLRRGTTAPRETSTGIPEASERGAEGPRP
jgi:cardiolipin synthase